MSFTDLAAIVGALAWLPPIVIALRSWLAKPQLRVITQPSPEIGYTTFGPILNLRLALTVTRKDIVVTGIRLQLTHESGEQTNFDWRGVTQRLGTMTYPQIGAVPFEKELNVLALKVSLKDVEERFVRFQTLAYLEKKSDLEASSLKKMAYLRAVNSFDAEAFLKSQEMLEIYSNFRQSFAWKTGGYRLKVLIESPDAFDVVGDEYTFNLSPLQVQEVSSNLAFVEQFYSNEILPRGADEPVAQVQWKWVYPDMPAVHG